MSSCSNDSQESGQPNVVLVVVDTLRADKLGSYGNPVGLTPNMDRLADKGARFASAQSHAPWTLPSLASLFSSAPPPEHGAGGGLTAEGPQFLALDEEVLTLAEVLSQAGYQTAAFTNVTFLQPQFGLLQGFEHRDGRSFENNLQVRSAAETNAAATAWIEQQVAAQQPYFAFVHYFDTHAVYDPPDHFRQLFAAPADRQATDSERFLFGTREQMIQLRSGQLQLNPGVVKRAEKLYDAEVAATDQAFGQLYERVEQLNKKAAPTLWVLTSDHGEEFYDHAGFEHGHTLYGELLKVPLIFAGVGVQQLEPQESAGLIDIAPTILELCKVQVPLGFRGQSLTPLLDGTSEQSLAAWPARPHLAHGNMWGPSLDSLQVGDWKLIRPSDARGLAELYQLDLDPVEAQNRASEEPTRFQKMQTTLDAVLADLALRRGEVSELSSDTIEELRALGYIGELPTQEKQASTADPKK